MQAGYKYAYENGYDIAIQVDADGQHDPKEIQQLLRTLEGEKADVAMGSRFMRGSSYKGSIMRRIGIAIFSGVISMIVRQKITDPTHIHLIEQFCHTWVGGMMEQSLILISGETYDVQVFFLPR